MIVELQSPPRKYLSERDAELAKLISHVGEYKLNPRRDYFGSLVKAIIGQQLSAKVAIAIWDRLQARCPDMNAKCLSVIGDEELREVGFSGPKIKYLRDLSSRVLAGELDFAAISRLPDEEVIATLTQVKGIGRWTAEIFLIFSLGRQDILPLDDVGLQRAVKWLYGLEETPRAEELRVYGERWRPYRSVASLYLWEVINQSLISLDTDVLGGSKGLAIGKVEKFIL